MINPVELILQQTGVKNSYFTPNSRYFGLEVKRIESKDHQQKSYVKRRFIAQPEHFHIIEEHTVNQGERMDHIAHQYLSDSEQFWRICDANAVMHPNALTDTLGTKIKITLPEGVQGATK